MYRSAARKLTNAQGGMLSRHWTTETSEGLKKHVRGFGVGHAVVTVDCISYDKKTPVALALLSFGNLFGTNFNKRLYAKVYQEIEPESTCS
jgi:hypothetical protein